MYPTIDTSSLPTPTSSAPPDVVQVLPASSASTTAGTPVTIEGNYFGTTPQVFFGGVPATDVQVAWDGQLTADAPADPAGTSADQVVVTVTSSGESSSATPTQNVNEFTYAPATAPTISSVSPASGSQVPTGTVVIHGTNFYDAGVTPIIDFGNVASIGSMSYSSNQITTAIPPSINPGTVNITVTTPAGTSQVSANDLYTYSGSGPSAAPTITSGDATTFSAGSAGSYNVTTTATPAASSISDAAFSGCTPSALPSGFSLVYTGGATATLEGTPVAGDGGSYVVCLVASNGVGTSATQSFLLTVNAPARTRASPLAAAGHPTSGHPRLLVGRFGRRHLQFRHRRVSRFDRVDPPATTDRRDHPDGRPQRVLARGVGRGDLRLR